MEFPEKYLCLTNSKVFKGAYGIIPIRYGDRNKIMQWRNEQIYHLRQARQLTPEMQEEYYRNTVKDLFNETRPKQLLFSFLKDQTCIGYGGLVHINWVDRNAEISFIMDTSLEKEGFHENWSQFLALIEEIAFKELAFHKIYVYAFDLRKHLYRTLKKNGYFMDAVLNNHCYFDGSYIDVVIHSKLNKA